jgi:glycosyltransferase involved in cell wall biosynthesis
MFQGSRVFVVVPAWQEGGSVTRVLRGMPALVDAVVVVDDGSTDTTARDAHESGDPRVAVMRHTENRGVGAAIATGYAWALASDGGPRDAIVVMAGDGQMDPADLPAVVAPIAEGDADYVKGDRFRFHDGARSMPKARKIGGLAFSLATSRAIGVPVSDSQCGYTAIAREACERLDLGALWPRYGYPNDLLSQIALRGMRIAEVPVRAVYAGEVSRLRPRHVPVIAALVARAWVRRLRQA